MAIDEGLKAHLKTGLTTVARCWQILRKDGDILGFTDHDRDLEFADTVFRADTGLTAVALEQAVGLSIDNTEAIGALSDAAISEADIEAGRFDGAVVTAWMVNWADISERTVLFRGSIGEITRADGVFRAELRGLAEPLNRPFGRVYQKCCTAVLGDASCGLDLLQSGLFVDLTAVHIEEQRIFTFAAQTEFVEGWFELGRMDILDGRAQGTKASIKSDRNTNGLRVIELWEPLRAEVAKTDNLRLIAGCDKRFATCRGKFENQLNFQGFPDLPSDDWIAIQPRRDGDNSGGSLR